MQSLYNLISIAGLVLYLPRLLLKKGPEDRGTFIKERLGMADYQKTDIWVHAVSVGETLACIPFLKTLKKDFPGKKILLSTTTYTGQKIAREKFPEADRIMYMPLDSVLCIKKAVRVLSPEIFITVETELWPALFHGLKKAGSRVIILNGRISKESYQGYNRIKFLMKNMLSQVDFFYMQGKDDAERIISLGADRHKVGFMGNFKFDIDFRESAPPEWLAGIKNKFLLAASTHRGEEEIILDAFNNIRDKLKGTTLVIAPRHPERFNEVAEMIEKRKFSFLRRSAMNGDPAIDIQRSSPDIILIDTIGELSKVFSRASVAFIGGSLVPTGGHNIMEPAYWSTPIIFGPHMDNFPIAEEFIDRAAALEVRDADDIADKVMALLIDTGKAADMGRAARSIVDKNTGAVKKAIELIRSYIGTS